jgi:surface carbohydrate biosynthesis protein (TIGR04326 family)
LSDLVRLAVARELRSRQAWALYFKVIGRSLKRRGVRPKLLIHLYENQPWEKCLRAGFRAHLPETSIVAAQHSSFPELYLSFYPTRREIENGNLHDLLVTIGDEYNKRFREFSHPSGSIVAGGALRYAKFFSKADAANNITPDALEASSKAILCCTGIAYDSALELVYRALEATSELTYVRVVVNYHPATTSEFRERLKADITRFLKDGFREPEYSTLSVQQLLSQVDVVLYNISGAALEGLAMGVPAVFVGSEIGIDYDTIADVKLAQKGRSVAEIRRAIEECLDQGRFDGVKKIEIRDRLHRHMDKVKIEVWRSVITEFGGHGPNR